MNSLIQDLRYALRQLRKSPGFSITVIVTLALGIGANAAVFTLFDQVLLRMLPVQKPQELVRFEWNGAFNGSMSSFGGDSKDHHNYFSYPMYKDLRDQNQVFSGILAADKAQVGLSWHNQSESDDAEVVSGNYFQVLGLNPAVGRLFTPQDDTAKDSNPVTVLSYNYWRTHLGAARDVVGQTILINGHSFTIVGVAPPNFDSAIGGYRPSVFVPASMVDIAIPWRAPLDDLTNHQSAWLTWLRASSPEFRASKPTRACGTLWHSLRANELPLFKHTSERFRKNFVELSTFQVLDDSKGFNPNRGDLQKPLIILMSMACLLVILCAINVATLLLLRAADRAREMSMRYALGARRGRIVRSCCLKEESSASSERWLESRLRQWSPLIGTPHHQFRSRFRALLGLGRSAGPAFHAGALSIGNSLLQRRPGLSLSPPRLADALRQNTGTLSKDSQRFRKLAVGAQIALSVLLLGGAGLFLRTFDNLRNQSVGFETAKLVTFALNPTNSGYGEDRTAQIVYGFDRCVASRSRRCFCRRHYRSGIGR